ncbi:mediator complex subunit [Tilletia horrida]|nr:mediator complex subunit [Tilletia horrida]
MDLNGGFGSSAETAGAAGTSAGSTSRHVNGHGDIARPSKAGTPSQSKSVDLHAAASAVMPPPPLIVKSEKAQGKARQVDAPESIMAWTSSAPQDDTPPEQLLAEILPQTENLVPLAAIVERMSNYGYEALQILSETLSSLPSDQRRLKIFTTAVTVQRQIAKLVALTLWSRLSKDLQKARDTVGLLCEQFAQAEDAVKELTAMRNMLPHSRLRNFDLISATEVLRAGALTSLPSVIKMSDYRISDGRAHFNVPDLFEASLTIDGPFPSGRWYLLTIRFHFKVTGVGKERFPRVPKKHFRDAILDQVNAELAPPPPLPPEDETKAATPQDAPLMRFFRHLESRALQYQLDILAHQAGEISNGAWRGNMAVERDGKTQALRLSYWTRLRPRPEAHRSAKPLAPHPLRNGGSITISIESEQSDRGSGRSLARILFGRSTAADVDSLCRKRLGVDWRTEKSIKEGLEYTPFQVNVGALDVQTLLRTAVHTHTSAILQKCRTQILQSSHVLGIGPQGCELRDGNGEGHEDQSPRLSVKLCGSMSISIGIDAITGRVMIEEDVIRVPDASSSSDSGTKADAAIFQQNSERLNRDPNHIVEVLQALRHHAIARDLEQKACFLGLECVPRLALQASEYAKLGAFPEALVFLALPQCPNWYLAAQFAIHPHRIALISTNGYMMNGQLFLVLNTLQWLDRHKFIKSLVTPGTDTEKGDTNDLADFELDELSHLHWYGVAIVNYFRIEQQLQARGLAISHTTSLPPFAIDKQGGFSDRLHSAITSVASKIPAICLRSHDVLGASSVLLKPNIFIRLSRWWDRRSCSAEIVVRLSLRSSTNRMTRLEPLALGGVGLIEYDAEYKQLTFSTSDIDNCIGWFLMEWDRFSRIGMLVKAVERARRWPGGRARGWKVTEFDFVHANFSYAPDRCASVTWSRSPTGHGTPEGYLLRVYTSKTASSVENASKLTFEEQTAEDVEEEDRNPHEYVEGALEQNLNMGTSYAPGFWPSFLCLLRETLPVLEILRTASKDSLKDVKAPALEFVSACWYRLRYGMSYALDIRYLTGSRFIIADASRPLFGPTHDHAASGLTALPDFHQITKEAVTDYYSLVQEAKQSASEGDDLAAQLSFGSKTDDADMGDSPAAVDLRRAVLCAADEAVVGPILSGMLASVREKIEKAGGDGEEAEAAKPTSTSTST